MFKRILVLGGLSGLVLLGAPSCSSDKSSCAGTEQCACYANATCNTGLDCRSNVCVNLNSTSAAGGASSGSGFDTKACFTCAESACASDASACKGSSGCETLTKCLVGCGTDTSCLTNCAKAATPDNIVKSGMYQVCALSNCTSDCTYSVSGLGGSGNGSGGSSTSSSAGSSSKAGNGSTSGGGSSVGGANGGGSAGSPPSDPVSGVNWLSLSAATAPSASGVNGKLGVEGVFHAYADDCSTATMSWDPTSRCISGTLCAADSAGSNWGAAIGFDFNNVASVKHAWSATTAGVTGIAWTTDSGTGSGSGKLQIWVQNMDPSFNGTCSSMSCNINAPPDGKPSISLGEGQLSFAAMQKDVWGPDAGSYVFNPADISALQFKLPAQSSPSQYTLCIQSLGLIR